MSKPTAVYVIFEGVYAEFKDRRVDSACNMLRVGLADPNSDTCYLLDCRIAEPLIHNGMARLAKTEDEQTL